MFFDAEHLFHGQSTQSADTELYDVLGVTKTASETEIKQAYRRLARQHHPDKGGDPEQFKKIASAYEVLSQKDKRSQYDRFGRAAFEGGGAAPGFSPFDMPDMFSNLFQRQSRPSTNNPKRHSPKPQRMEITVSQIPLSTFYSGGTVVVPDYKRQVMCVSCKGVGGSQKCTCRHCKGHGIQVVVRSLGPGMIQQMQTICEHCSGSGSQLKKPCVVCKSSGTTCETVSGTTFDIPAGTHDRHVFVCKGIGNWDNTHGYGHVHFQAVAAESSVYKRYQNHVVYRTSITLQESLLGFALYLPSYLDGRRYVFKSVPRLVYPDGCFCRIPNIGFTSVTNVSKRGDLYVHLRIEWPAQLPEAIVQQFPPPVPRTIHDDGAVEVGVDGPERELVNLRPLSKQNVPNGVRSVASDGDETIPTGDRSSTQGRAHGVPGNMSSDSRDEYATGPGATTEPLGNGCKMQ